MISNPGGGALHSATDFPMMRSGLQSEVEWNDGDDMVIINKDPRKDLGSDDDDSDNSLNRQTDKRTSI